MGLEMLSIAKKINLLEISLDDFVESLKEVLEEQKSRMVIFGMKLPYQ